MSKSSEKVYEKLREMILSGELAPGTQLREEEVAEWCDVSRTPVREAMRQMEAELFIRRSDTQRSYVAQWKLPDIEEFFTLRGMLESHAARRAAGFAKKEDLERLDEINRTTHAAIMRNPPDVDGFLAANVEFHSAILEMASSESLAALLNRLILQPIIKRTAERYSKADLERSYAEHVEITAAISHNDGDWASYIVSAHIRRAFNVFSKRNHGGPEV